MVLLQKFVGLMLTTFLPSVKNFNLDMKTGVVRIKIRKNSYHQETLPTPQHLAFVLFND